MSFSSKDLEHLLDRLHEDETQQEELGFERSLTDNALRTLAPAQPPRDLSLRIRVALSKERVRAQHNWLHRMKERVELFVENTLRPMAVQAGVATVALVAITGGALMLSAPQQAVEANDEPLAGFSAPRYLYSPAGENPLASVNEAPLIVKAMVDSTGRVYDYQVLSGALDSHALESLRQRMLTGIFQPARVFDHPVRGSVLLTFGDVVVRG
ncbi:hypothetical protein [Terriglobus roseus]|uniref:Uncharacterized protein n=1 Tax=Terriglobus roseus TaxID=392734 RepID=A0A1G7NBL8_9BACT|nr:hypothetical protein [Terriglobus roseus]SDF71394.1 hypothetical protein SAMN05444167_3084 [Terriglobus roseus]